MATFKVSSVTAVLLALLIVGSQAKPHTPGIWPSVHVRGIDLTLRQDCSGYTPPSGCSLTVNTGDFSALNAGLSKVCVARCIEPAVANFRKCSNYTLAQQDYYVKYVTEYMCGKNGDDYCPVLYSRNYLNDVNILNPNRDCTFSSPTFSQINCTSASSACLQSVADFSSKMGCCTLPYFGEGVSSCSGVDVEPACQYSSAVAVALSVFPLLLALISVMF